MSFPGVAPVAPPGGATTELPAATAPASPAPGLATLALTGVEPGPPVDVWDTDSETGRYYWTVVPVDLNSDKRLQDQELPQDNCRSDFGGTKDRMLQLRRRARRIIS
jgi:hypothetical protein